MTKEQDECFRAVAEFFKSLTKLVNETIPLVKEASKKGRS